MTSRIAKGICDFTNHRFLEIVCDNCGERVFYQRIPTTTDGLLFESRQIKAKRKHVCEVIYYENQKEEFSDK